ncbi:MAG: hypothetical protein EZS28_027581 [Streblomastix strix]|uniref:Uncharacterized protein n=1 Tax=Streblomastix strix TaxID=222440 RepID=A0A5J4V466_9EUKA|nr:MAG: hypothetical protein EZS28_027581 [Streblomastix strix]
MFGSKVRTVELQLSNGMKIKTAFAFQKDESETPSVSDYFEGYLRSRISNLRKQNESDSNKPKIIPGQPLDPSILKEIHDLQRRAKDKEKLKLRNLSIISHNYERKIEPYLNQLNRMSHQIENYWKYAIESFSPLQAQLSIGDEEQLKNIVDFTVTRRPRMSDGFYLAIRLNENFGNATLLHSYSTARTPYLRTRTNLTESIRNVSFFSYFLDMMDINMAELIVKEFLPNSYRYYLTYFQEEDNDNDNNYKINNNKQEQLDIQDNEQQQGSIQDNEQEDNEQEEETLNLGKTMKFDRIKGEWGRGYSHWKVGDIRSEIEADDDINNNNNNEVDDQLIFQKKGIKDKSKDKDKKVNQFEKDRRRTGRK